MKKLIFTFTSLMFLVSGMLNAEVISRILTYNGPGNQIDKCNAIAQDKAGYVYATGVSWGGNSKEDYATIKFGEDGDFLWVARYNGPGNNLDYASAITVDNSGNVYVTGWSRSTADYGSEDFLTIKYNSNGVQQWAKRYDGAVTDCYYYDYARAIWVDAQGNVYVTGQSWGNDDLRDDYLTLKYNSSGTLVWAKRYNGPSSKEDIAYSLFLDAAGNVYVTGGSVTNNKGFDMLTVKYNNGGTQQWAARYDGPAYLDDISNEVKADMLGNVYITGSSHGGNSKLDYVTIKYNSSGQQQWLKRFNGAANDTDVATGLGLDAYNHVYVTGYSKNLGASGYDYNTIKYSNYDGTQLWNCKYDGGSHDKALDIKVVVNSCISTMPQHPEMMIPCYAIDIYVTGQSIGTGTNYDFYTQRLDENGNLKWGNRFNGPTNGVDAAYSISVYNGYPIMYVGGSFGSDYGIIGITEQNSIGDNSFKGISMSYPNPFNPETKISFNLVKESGVNIEVYDVLGRTVAVLANGKYEQGIHSVNFNASSLNSGVYFYRIETDYASETKKIVLIK
jgi:hypothetical protein